MKLSAVKQISDEYPTITDIDQEMYLISLLQGISILEIEENPHTFMEIVKKIQESHHDNGIFEVTDENENIFLTFADWLISLENTMGIDTARFADGLNLSADAIAKAMSPGAVGKIT